MKYTDAVRQSPDRVHLRLCSIPSDASIATLKGATMEPGEVLERGAGASVLETAVVGRRRRLKAFVVSDIFEDSDDGFGAQPVPDSVLP